MRSERARDVLTYRVLALATAERGDDDTAARDAWVDYCRAAVDAAAKELVAALAAEQQKEKQ